LKETKAQKEKTKINKIQQSKQLKNNNNNKTHKTNQNANNTQPKQLLKAGSLQLPGTRGSHFLILTMVTFNIVIFFRKISTNT